jgi:hypothetical protein
VAKPRLEEFWKCFEQAVLELNTTYKSSKQQFENDMKAYKDCGNFKDDDDLWAQQFTSAAPENAIIHKSNTANATTPCFAQRNQDAKQAKKDLERIGLEDLDADEKSAENGG